jgi:hypothetical protein
MPIILTTSNSKITTLFFFAFNVDGSLSPLACTLILHYCHPPHFIWSGTCSLNTLGHNMDIKDVVWYVSPERVIKLLQNAHVGRQVYAIQNDGSRMEKNIGRGYLGSKGRFEG